MKKFILAFLLTTTLSSNVTPLPNPITMVQTGVVCAWNATTNAACSTVSAMVNNPGTTIVTLAAVAVLTAVLLNQMQQTSDATDEPTF